jgi:hypothetical protein
MNIVEGFFISLQYLKFNKSLFIHFSKNRKTVMKFLNFKTIRLSFWHLEYLQHIINFKPYTLETKKIKSNGNWEFQTSFLNNRRLTLQHPKVSTVSDTWKETLSSGKDFKRKKIEIFDLFFTSSDDRKWEPICSTFSSTLKAGDLSYTWKFHDSIFHGFWENWKAIS